MTPTAKVLVAFWSSFDTGAVRWLNKQTHLLMLVTVGFMVATSCFAYSLLEQSQATRTVQHRIDQAIARNNLNSCDLLSILSDPRSPLPATPWGRSVKAKAEAAAEKAGCDKVRSLPR